MKRALALIGATMALSLVGVSSASAACAVPYCPSPTVSATGATAIGTGSATLNATINTNGGNAATWSISLNGGIGVVATGTIPDGTTNVPLSVTANGLTAGVFYTYTVTVTNSGSTASSSSSFSTVALPPAPEPTPTPTPTPTPNDTPSTNPPSTTPSTSPSSNPSPPTTAEKREAASNVEQSLGGDATVKYKTVVGGALVFSVSGADTDKKTGTPVLGLTLPDGADLKVEAPKLKAGKQSITPKVTTTVNDDGTAVVSVKLSDSQVAALRKAGKTSFKITITVTGADGKAVDKQVTVKIPKAEKKKNKG